ncbi:Glycine cleavage system H protein [Sporomusa ovata DSM 2662]|uniref:Glycine cleavage system H protein n=1 Tax=Sporomusa ovata TaxID=2378 RepID=A0A0U1L1C6_9FIRM|nr:glycine cleavage system protein H [Sporomusa ovata]EQB24546.1 glycine cleavage system H protein [Sporomusa ovata DSM 2662]CQR73488.1 Glycine cleavage system H protein [Sporomusa ovata]
MSVSKWSFPEELLYDTHYQWIKRVGNKVQFGLTPYGLDITGDVLYLVLPTEGTVVEGGGTCGSLEAGKWVGRVYAPVSGLVTKVNDMVAASPALISQLPYNCWFAEIELSRPAELDGLMSAAAMQAWLAEDMKENA